MIPTTNQNGAYTTVQRLLPRHARIKDLTALGVSPSDIASQLSMTTRNVYNIINSPSFQHELSLTRSSIDSSITETLSRQADDVATIIAAQTRRAAERLGILIDSADEAIALRAAADVLDRGGYPKLTKSDNTTRSSILIDDAQAATISESLLMLGFSKEDLPNLQSKPADSSEIGCEDSEITGTPESAGPLFDPPSRAGDVPGDKSPLERRAQRGSETQSADVPESSV
jgi:hypothetical protein